jgi:hypothetical protein
VARRRGRSRRARSNAVIPTICEAVFDSDIAAFGRTNISKATAH